jgi:hypothetical protein
LDRASLDETLEYVERPKEVRAKVSISSPAEMHGILGSARQVKAVLRIVGSGSE